MGVVSQAIQESKSEVEKSLYAFFLLNAFQGARKPTIRNYIERTLNVPSHEMNLIGCYLYQSKPQITLNDIEGIFSAYILKKKPVGGKTTQGQQLTSTGYYMLRADALIPVDSPAAILGLSRKKRVRNSVELLFPEKVHWEKVMFKIKEGMREIEIFYNGKYIQTADYIQLGFFTGNKQQKPNRAWGFLTALSVLAGTDIQQATVYNMRKMVAIHTQETISTPSVHQIKRSLVKMLREICKTDDDPFHVYQDYYHPKFTILPEPTLRRKEIWPQGGRLNENRSSVDSEEEAL